MQAAIIIGIIVGVLIVVGGAILKSPKVKGILGERKVRRVIGKTIEGEQYVINNVLFDTESKSCQIDHIVINRNGVFVIETKNYSGRVYGNDSQHEWTQVLRYGKVKNKFYSPVKQNQTHVYELKKIVGKETPIKSMVVFVQGNTKYITSEYICPLRDVKKTLGNPVGGHVLDKDEMSKINNLILEAKNASTTSNRQHVKNIQEMKKDIENDICPRCGGKLVLKKSKYGNFYGCENYPKCTFTKKEKK